MNPYSRFSTVDILSSELRYTGYFIDNLIKSSTFDVYVAENKTVYLSFGNRPSIYVISYSKPIFSIESASSIININKLCIEKFFVFTKWSKSLPGVAMIILAPLHNLIYSYFLLAPPITSYKVLFSYIVKETATSYIY